MNNKQQKAVIFDLDGTLANIDHRLHHVTNGNTNYDAFFDECDKDTPKPVICQLLRDLSVNYTIIIASGRSDVVKEKTEAWLKKNGLPYHHLLMRNQLDHRSDVIVKGEILDYLLAAGFEIEFVVDDRQVVVDMWRKRGLTCLQCEAWIEGRAKPALQGDLVIMVGPSGAGKTTYLEKSGFHPQDIVSSDHIRSLICEDFRDQTKNAQVFEALHRVVEARIDNGLTTVVDATNLRRKDRLAVVALAKGGPVGYIVIDRPMEEKRRDGGWRNELDFDLLAKHQQTFDSQIKDILAGDGLENVTVIDGRKK